MLFTPHRLGKLELPHRIVMPPHDPRAGAGNVPTALMATYYAQRASAGLIVSEGTQVSPQGQGYAWTPGIHSPAQVAAGAASPRPCMRQAAASSRSCGMSAGSRTSRCNRRAQRRCLRRH